MLIVPRSEMIYRGCNCNSLQVPKAWPRSGSMQKQRHCVKRKEGRSIMYVSLLVPLNYEYLPYLPDMVLMLGAGLYTKAGLDFLACGVVSDATPLKGVSMVESSASGTSPPRTRVCQRLNLNGRYFSLSQVSYAQLEPSAPRIPCLAVAQHHSRL